MYNNVKKGDIPMFAKERANEIKKLVFDTIGYKSDFDFDLTATDGVFAEKKGGRITVGGKTIPMLARAFFLCVLKEKKGEDSFKIEEKAHFSRLGRLLDVSRNGVLKVEAVKRYINYMVTLGMNVVILYMEDIFEVEEYPYFGYMRGRYSLQELKEIDDYAYSLGVEVIGYMETLGHMEQYLRWGEEHTKVKTTSEDVMLVDDDATYEFIETCLRTLRKTLRSDYVFVGIDEAPMMIRGKYYDLHGPSDFYTVYMRHLSKVCDICTKIGYKAGAPTDMICALFSPSRRYHDVNLVFDEKVKSEIPENLVLMYWNYGRDTYDAGIKAHQSLDREVLFLGGGQNWFGYLPWYSVMVDNAKKGLKASLENGVDFVATSTFGDDGCETNHFLSVNDLAYYSEYCYKGLDCTDDDIFSAAELISGISEEDAQILFGINLRIDDATPTWDQKTVFLKDLLYSDILYELGTPAKNCAVVLPRMKENVAKLKANPEKCNGLYEYVYYLQAIITTKAELRINLRNEYKKGNKEYLKNVCEEVLPELIEQHKKYYELLKEMWHRDYKPFGIEVLTKRFGGYVQRITDIKERMEKYLNGGEPIWELEEKILPTIFYGGANDLFSPSKIESWSRNHPYRD